MRRRSRDPKALGESAATILNLELLDDMRVPHSKATKRGCQMSAWWSGGRPLEEYSHEQAEARAKEIALLAQLVFWGKVYEFGDGAIAQMNLFDPEIQGLSRS